jgi:hemerythrin-like domain-containing protein
MDTATKNLEKDHENILRLIAVMENVQLNTEPDVNHLETIIDLIRNYADGFHHAKEEELLFPLMAQRGFSTENGPVAVMLHEHTTGREYVKNASQSINKYKAGDKASLPEIYRNMRGYTDLLRNHIAKENNVLFRMADRVLTEQDQQQLLKQFDKVENSNLCGGVLQDCIKAIDKLAKAYKL